MHAEARALGLTISVVGLMGAGWGSQGAPHRNEHIEKSDRENGLIDDDEAQSNERAAAHDVEEVGVGEHVRGRHNHLRA